MQKLKRVVAAGMALALAGCLSVGLTACGSKEGVAATWANGEITEEQVTNYVENMRSLYQILRRCTMQDGRGLENLDMAPCYAATTNLERALMNCAELYFQEREERSAGRYSEHVADAMAFIRRHYMEDISVADIAGAASLSEGHLRRLFKQELNTSVIDYLTEYRIEKAKVLLQQRSRPASQIWQETGFSSAQYFSYVFRKKEGKTPKEYQNERTDE